MTYGVLFLDGDYSVTGIGREYVARKGNVILGITETLAEAKDIINDHKGWT